MPVPDIILKLADRFEANRDAYKSPGYNETQVRLEFLDPFFEALGWDIHNKQGHAEAYKDVIHEDAIKVGNGTAGDHPAGAGDCHHRPGHRPARLRTLRPDGGGDRYRGGGRSMKARSAS